MSKFKVGDEVGVDGGAGGDYFGRIIELVPELTMSSSAYDDTQETRPGVYIHVTRWDGTPDNFEIQAWECQTYKTIE